MKKCNDECRYEGGCPAVCEQIDYANPFDKGPGDDVAEPENELPCGVGLMSTEDGLSVAFNTDDGKTWQFLLQEDCARDLAKMILAVVGD